MKKQDDYGYFGKGVEGYMQYMNTYNACYPDVDANIFSGISIFRIIPVLYLGGYALYFTFFSIGAFYRFIKSVMLSHIWEYIRLYGIRKTIAVNRMIDFELLLGAGVGFGMAFLLFLLVNCICGQTIESFFRRVRKWTLIFLYLALVLGLCLGVLVSSGYLANLVCKGAELQFLLQFVIALAEVGVFWIVCNLLIDFWYQQTLKRIRQQKKVDTKKLKAHKKIKRS